ncbi:MAG: aminomethyl-transferring glycine dehydrogenase subunit GcvPB [Thermoplasmata archaeon]|nr:aminomethyl-transferring glycine dehydrogenase subunit GcvPB [Thermoplasmata archaeon]MCI4359425.1 aminomethyl-transferring glycine dehydrogenase subunit GcvPB [Thermoplasmata archaeon]
MTFRQARYDEPLLWDIRRTSPEGNPPAVAIPGIPERFRRQRLIAWPELSELELIRHFTRLSQMNFGINTSSYPLGSCTMKYNPAVSEQLARRRGAAEVHPYQPEETVQGSLEVIWRLERGLQRVTGLPEVSLQAAAGAHGEYSALLMIRAYFRDRGELDRRTEVLLPDTAHGTNPASAAMAGFTAREIPSKEGCVDVAALRAAVSDRTAAFMLTNPNTTGLFESEIDEIAKAIHGAGGLLYYDGANLNAILAVTNPGRMGFDVAHLNLHKTFATPHGGGGPGAGVLAAGERLAPYLPVPRVVKVGRKFRLDYDRPKSIGKIKTAYGNFGLDLRAYAYLLYHGEEGLKHISRRAVLNSNYLARALSQTLPRPFRSLVKHEFLLSGAPLKARGARTLDLAKRLLDEGIHAPTIYFPALVDEALMIEMPETESRHDLDRFVEAFQRAATDTTQNLHAAPRHTSVRRVDEVLAARELRLSWRDLREPPTAPTSPPRPPGSPALPEGPVGSPAPSSGSPR